jgi:hypothetical protein
MDRFVIEERLAVTTILMSADGALFIRRALDADLHQSYWFSPPTSVSSRPIRAKIVWRYNSDALKNPMTKWVVGSQPKSFEWRWNRGRIRGDGDLYLGLANLPYWFITLLSAPGILIPVMYGVMVRRRRRARRRAGRCGTCGYDLTGNVSGRCPECGEVIPEKPEE